MNKFLVVSLGGLITLGAPFAAVQAGVDEMAQKCDVCHGKGGNGDDLKVPNIAGMSKTYLHDMLMAYQSGDRPAVKYKPKDGEETDMGAVAKKLSEDDINAISAHYAGLTYQPHVQTADAGMAAKGKKVFDKACDKCHSEGGTVADDDAGLLAGQGRPYLEEQFKMYDDGSRSMPKKMKKKYEALDDGQKAAILEYLVGGSK